MAEAWHQHPEDVVARTSPRWAARFLAFRSARAKAQDAAYAVATGIDPEDAKFNWGTPDGRKPHA